jgi:hypothetical protein
MYHEEGETGRDMIEIVASFERTSTSVETYCSGSEFVERMHDFTNLRNKKKKYD